MTRQDTPISEDDTDLRALARILRRLLEQRYFPDNLGAKRNHA